MLLALHPNWWDDWELYHKVTFDGEARQIIINPGVTQLDFKNDIYSSWKEWVRLRDNTKFLPAIRTTGGDPVGGGLYAGDIYFLQYGWQIVVRETVAVSGTVYHDDSIPVYIIEAGGGITSTVSNLSYAYSAPGLTALQSQLLLELAKIHGLIANTPLVVTPTTRTAGDVSQTIVEANNTVTVTRI
jgi:hypothetical protein